MSNSVRPHRQQPPGFPVPGILQARTLEWVDIQKLKIYVLKYTTKENHQATRDKTEEISRELQKQLENK